MSRPVGSRSTDIRYRPDVGFERRCESCSRAGGQCFWPITLEFWNPKSLQRCRGCERMARNRRASEKYRRSEAERVRRQKGNQKWRTESGAAYRRLYDRNRARHRPAEQVA